MEYPQYLSHKQVSAVKIAEVDRGADGSLTLHLEGGFDNVVIQHQDTIGKPRPSAGWYLVVYEGGYSSFSPGEAFEKNHTLLDGASEEVLDAANNHGQDEAAPVTTG